MQYRFTQTILHSLDQYVSDRVSLYNGDSVEVLKGLPDNCIHYAIFSPPFSSLYTYSNSDRDMGNSASDEQFNTHFKFLIRELARVIMPGRLVSVHCMDIPKMKSRALGFELKESYYKQMVLNVKKEENLDEN